MIIPSQQNLLSYRHDRINSMSKIFPEPPPSTPTINELKTRIDRDLKLLEPNHIQFTAYLEEKSSLPSSK